MTPTTVIDRRAMIGMLGAGGAIATLPTLAAAPRPWAVAGHCDGFVARGQLPGVAAAVGRGTSPARFAVAGRLSFDKDAPPVTPDSLFRIYSMTKPVTGIAAMILVDDRRLTLDQPLADILPAFAKMRVLTDPLQSLDARAATRAITIRHLLTHSAGFGYTIITRGPLLAEYLRLGLTPGVVSRRGVPGAPLTPAAPDLATFADRLATLPLIAEPGTVWRYSLSLDLMARVIEVASGQSFETFLRNRIFAPLGMASTGFRVPDRDLARMATNYGIGPRGRFVIDDGATSVFGERPPFAFGGAGLVSSPRDYDRFLAMLMGEGRLGSTRILSPRAARLAMSDLLPPGVNTAGTWVAGQGFGAGGRVVRTATPGGPGVGTFGWSGAAATTAWVDRARGVRAGGYAQFMPDQALPFTDGLVKAVYQ